MSNVNKPMSNNWRASLVPAAAVIPAPTAYTNIVAVKTLVVQCRAQGRRVEPWFTLARSFWTPADRPCARLTWKQHHRSNRCPLADVLFIEHRRGFARTVGSGYLASACPSSRGVHGSYREQLRVSKATEGLAHFG